MDFVLTDDQRELQHEFRRFLANKAPLARATAELPGQPSVVDRVQWVELGSMGVFDLAGSGLGSAEAVIVYEELGRVGFPGPLLATFAAAEFVAGAASGTAIVGAIDADADGPWLVEHLGDLDVLLVVRETRVEQLDEVPRGDAIAEPLDPLTPMWRVEELPGGRAVCDANSFETNAGLVGAAFQVGLGQASLDLAVEYALARRQFGRVIGGFQAIKHLLADTAVAVEVARAAVHAAALSVDEGAPSHRLHAGARIVASRAADRAGRTCVQVHGGLGFTWDLDAHRLLKRGWVIDQSCGGIDSVPRSLAEHL